MSLNIVNVFKLPETTTDSDVNNSIISKCRVCFEKKDDLHSIFKRRKGASAYDKLLACTKLNINKNDGGPSLICVDCLKELEITVKFHEKCEKSNKILGTLNLSFSQPDEFSSQINGEEWSYIINPSTVKKEGVEEEKGLGCLECGQESRCKHTGRFQCHLCGKQFAKKHNLNVHRERHTGERRFVCPVCGERRYTRGELLSHTKTHGPSLTKPHSCHLCHKRFTVRANLHIHLRTHTGERPHQCDVCDKGFISKTTLTVHQRIHTGEKPYMCNICGQQFASNKMSRHLRSHSRVSRKAALRVACPHCSKRYSHRQSLNKHLSRYHKDKVIGSTKKDVQITKESNDGMSHVVG